MCILHIYTGTMPSTPDSPTAPPDPVSDAVAALLTPLATLAVARGLTCATVEEQLRHAFVRAAFDAHPEALPHRRVSRVAASTGLSRREVTRLLEAPGAPAPRAALASEVFARWTTAAAYRDAAGHPLALPRTGSAPSFEALAHDVTWDVHPRTLLDELVRLGFAELDAGTDTVRLLGTAFVPRGDDARMLGFLAANVGDHLRSAVANVLGARPPQLEQAVFSDELSAASIEALQTLVAERWRTLVDELVPAIDALIQQDREAGRPQDGRIRIGLYTFGETGPTPERNTP